jgi:hypothetical protein
LSLVDTTLAQLSWVLIVPAEVLIGRSRIRS